MYNEKDQLQNVIKWNTAEKQFKYRTNYPLNSNSIVFDVGSFDGKWAYQIYDEYFCKIYAFEPVSFIFEKTKDLIGNLPNVNLYQFGLGGNTREEDIVLI